MTKEHRGKCTLDRVIGAYEAYRELCKKKGNGN